MGNGKNTITITNDNKYLIGATGIDDILQCIKVIILTAIYSTPLDRGFAHTADMIDAPTPRETARLCSIFVDALERYESRIKVENIEIINSKDIKGVLMNGTLTPKITFTIRDGVEL